MPNPSDHEPEDAAERPSVPCSFCLKESKAAGTLIEGPQRDELGCAYICRNCVEICFYIFIDQKQKGHATENATAVGQFAASHHSRR